MSENDETEDRDRMAAENSDNDDCTFGQSTKKHILREILHNGVEIRPNIIDDFGGWDTSFTIPNSKPLKSNTGRCSKILLTTSAFPRPSTEPKENSYLFRHYDDISEYIKQYRRDQSVKGVHIPILNLLLHLTDKQIYQHVWPHCCDFLSELVVCSLVYEIYLFVTHRAVLL
jgi:hypothetical protein